MEKKEIQFKTNIKCGGCIASVKPHLDNAQGIGHWNVDTNSKDKVLTVTSDGANSQQIIDIVKKAGFKAETINP